MCNVYDIERDEFRVNQNVRNVASRNYLYGSDDSVEGFLANKVESPAAESLAAILKAPEVHSDIADIALLRFITVLMSRTPEAYAQFLDMVDAFTKPLFGEIARQNNFDVESAEAVRIRPSDPSAVLAYQATAAAMQCHLIRDLKLHIVLNDTETEFLLADHPVFQHNWYLRESGSLETTSIVCNGLQIFLPLSPKVTCCLYDGEIYQYGSGIGHHTRISNSTDVKLLNSFQALCADMALVCKSENMKVHAIELGREYKGKRPFAACSVMTPATQAPDGNLKSTYATWRKQFSVDQMPTFVKIRDEMLLRGAVVKERQPGNLAAYREFMAGANAIRN